MEIAIGFCLWMVSMPFIPEKMLKAIRGISTALAALLLFGVVAIPANIWFIGMVMLMLTAILASLFLS